MGDFQDIANQLANLASSLVNVYNAFNTLKVEALQSELAVEIKKGIQFINNELAKHATTLSQAKACDKESCTEKTDANPEAAS